jgi:acyl-coenzyme A synthetase/AMP-(fatty) acid ligase
MRLFAETEKKLCKHAAIEICALIETGVPEIRMKGDDMVLVVKKSEDYAKKPNEIVIRELMAYSRDILPPHMVPKKIIIVESIPMMSRNRIDRKAMQTEVIHRLAHI